MPRQHPALETIGERIRRLRKRLKLSQAVLGQAVGVSTSAVQKWESGETSQLKAENLLALAAALKVRAEYLQFGEGELFRSAFEEMAEVVDRIRGSINHPAGTPLTRAESIASGVADGLEDASGVDEGEAHEG